MSGDHFGWLEQRGADVAAGDEWLSRAEAEKMASLRIAKRRADWRLGRWTAKNAVVSYFSLPSCAAVLAAIEIRAATSGAPEAYIDGVLAPVAISLTHCCGIACCAVAPSGAALGCDLEAVEPRSPAFVADYFTEKEQETIARAPQDERDAVVTVLWSAKESALKALHEGLRLDTRSASVELSESVSGPWKCLHVSCAGGIEFAGWWRVADGLARTAICASAPVALTPALAAAAAR